MPSVPMTRWQAFEDLVVREEWRKGRVGACARVHARLPKRSLPAIQQRASTLAREDRNNAAYDAAAPPKTAVERPATRGGFIRPTAPAKVSRITYTAPPKVKEGPCDPGDIEDIRKRMEHLAMQMSGELRRTYGSVQSAMKQIADAGFRPIGGSRIATTDEVISNLSLPRGGHLRS